MESNLIKDVRDMHSKFRFYSAVDKMESQKLLELLKFRFKFLEEELTEGLQSIEKKDADGVVDAIIDLMVVSIGTLDLFNVNIDTAWRRVHSANMSKSAGSNPSRPNTFGFPDLIKPSNFVSPKHNDNVGHIEKAFK